jgi:hypothetical protein
MYRLMKPLISLLKNDPSQIDRLSVQQILALCGNGKLTDGSECSADLREYLQIAKSAHLLNYLKNCLQSPFERSGSVLQDVVNEVGRRLDYTVENGLYQGRSNAVGFDGLWTDPRGHTIVVEVKTTDAYRINLDVIGGYRNDLILSGKIASEASILLVVGRQDTGDLEAQVRGSRHAWTIRIISADALSKLVTLKENTELASAAKIHELLVPFEYTRLDKIIDIAFTVAEEASEAVEEQVPADEKTTAGSLKQRHTPGEIIEQVRAEIVAALSRKYSPLVKKSRALYWSVDKSVRAEVTISKVYESGGFWYAHHPQWDLFLSEADTGLLVLGCIGRDEAFAIPHSWIHAKLGDLYVTERENTKYWHLVLEPDTRGRLLLRLKDGESESLEAFKLPLSSPVAASA